MASAPAREAISALIDDRRALRIRVVPGAKIERAAIEHGALKLWTRTAPEDGKANKAVLAMLAKLLDVSPSTIELISGATSREKRVRIATHCS